MTWLICSCCAERPRGQLGDVDDLGVGRAARPAARGARAGRRPRCRPPSAPCGRPPRSARDRRGRRRRAPRRGRGRGGACVASAPSRMAVTMSSRRLAWRRGSRSAAELPITATVSPAWRPTAGVNAVAAYGVVGPHAEDAPLLGELADPLVDRRVVGGGHDVPGARRGRRPRSRARASAPRPDPTSPSMAGVTSGRDERGRRRRRRSASAPGAAPRCRRPRRGPCGLRAAARPGRSGGRRAGRSACPRDHCVRPRLAGGFRLPSPADYVRRP